MGWFGTCACSLHGGGRESHLLLHGVLNSWPSGVYMVRKHKLLTAAVVLKKQVGGKTKNKAQTVLLSVCPDIKQAKWNRCDLSGYSEFGNPFHTICIQSPSLCVYSQLDVGHTCFPFRLCSCIFLSRYFTKISFSFFPWIAK